MAGIPDYTGQQFIINPVDRPQTGVNPQLEYQRQMSDDKLMQAELSTMLGEDMTGLQEIEGVTSEAFNLWSEINQYARKMEAIGIDVTRPDITNPKSIEANKIFMTSMANLKHKVGKLKQGQKALNIADVAMGQQGYRPPEYLQPSQAYGEDVLRGLVGNKLEADVEALNKGTSYPMDLQSDVNKFNAQADALRDKYQIKADSASDPVLKEYFQMQVDAINDAKKNVEYRGSGGSGGNPKEKNPFKTLIPELIANKNIHGVAGELSTGDNVLYSPLTGSYIVTEKQGSGANAKTVAKNYDVTDLSRLYQAELRANGYDDNEINAQLNLWNPSNDAEFKKELEKANPVPRALRDKTNKLLRALARNAFNDYGGIEYLLESSKYDYFLPEGLGGGEYTGEYIRKISVEEDDVALKMADGTTFHLDSEEKIYDFLKANSPIFLRAENIENVKKMLTSRWMGSTGHSAATYNDVWNYLLTGEAAQVEQKETPTPNKNEIGANGKGTGTGGIY